MGQHDRPLRNTFCITYGDGTQTGLLPHWLDAMTMRYIRLFTRGRFIRHSFRANHRQRVIAWFYFNQCSRLSYSFTPYRINTFYRAKRRSQEGASCSFCVNSSRPTVTVRHAQKGFTCVTSQLHITRKDNFYVTVLIQRRIREVFNMEGRGSPLTGDQLTRRATIFQFASQKEAF